MTEKNTDPRRLLSVDQFRREYYEPAARPSRAQPKQGDLKMRLSYTTDANNNKSFNLPAEAIDIINVNRKRFSLRSVEKDLTPFNIFNKLRQILKMCDFSESRVKEETESGMKTTFDFGEIEKGEFVAAFNENRGSYALNELCLDNAEDAWTVLNLVSEN